MILLLRISLTLVLQVFPSGRMLGKWRNMSSSPLTCTVLFIPRYLIFKNVGVNFVARITNLVGNPPLSFFLLSLMSSFGYGIECLARSCIKKIYSCTEISLFTLSSNLFASLNKAITFGRKARPADFKRWSDTHRL